MVQLVNGMFTSPMKMVKKVLQGISRARNQWVSGAGAQSCGKELLHTFTMFEHSKVSQEKLNRTLKVVWEVGVQSFVAKGGGPTGINMCIAAQQLCQFLDLLVRFENHQDVGLSKKYGNDTKLCFHQHVLN